MLAKFTTLRSHVSMVAAGEAGMEGQIRKPGVLGETHETPHSNLPFYRRGGLC